MAGERNDVANFLLGMAVGVAVGAALGILLAPRSGAETRKLIRERAGEVREQIGEQVEALKARASELGERVQGLVAAARERKQKAEET